MPSLMELHTNLAYDFHSRIESTPDGPSVNLAANVRRPAVLFRGRVKDPVMFRQLMGTLHRVVLGDFRWLADDEWERLLDPVVTVHPDQIMMEAFSNDGACYGRTISPLSTFEIEGQSEQGTATLRSPIRFGTTNVDFTWELRAALDALRTSRRTLLSISADGFGVSTSGVGGSSHFEHKVDLPEPWVRGFLQVQSAFAMGPYVFEVRPVDLLTVIHYFLENKPPGPPHGLRYEFVPDEPVTAVLEPWEKTIVFKETCYRGHRRTVRLWGRRQMQLLLHILPYADRVRIGVLGRGLPHFYQVTCGAHTFVAALSGWTRNDWTRGSSFDLFVRPGQLHPEWLHQVQAYLSQSMRATAAEISRECALPRPEVENALFALCRAGRAMYDLTAGEYRWRELFAEPLQLDSMLALDIRFAAAEQLFSTGAVRFKAPPTPGIKPVETKVAAVVQDDEPYEVTVAVDSYGRLRFGRCKCNFFENNLMARGPCSHILATRLALDREFTAQFGLI